MQTMPYSTLSTTCQQILGHNCQLWVPIQVSDPLEQGLQHALYKEVFMQFASYNSIFKLI